MFLLLFFLVYIGCAIFICASWWKVFEKAGQPGWAAIIPLYNFYVMLKIVGKPGWWFAMLFIPFVNFIFIIWSLNMLSKSFGKDEGYTIGILLLQIVFIPILGFGDAIYIGPYGDQEAFQAAQNPHFDFEQNKPAIN